MLHNQKADDETFRLLGRDVPGDYDELFGFWMAGTSNGPSWVEFASQAKVL